MENTQGFYKLEDNNWYYGTEILFPDGTKLTLETKDNFDYPFREWMYYENAPQEYLDSLTPPLTPLNIYNI
jgi:hypothetical protein